MTELMANAPLAACESDVEDWSDFGDYRTTYEGSKNDSVNGNVMPAQNRVGDSSTKPGTSPPTAGLMDTYNESFSGSLEDLVNTFDEKVTKCFHNYKDDVEKFAPVQVRSQDEVMNDCQMWWTITGNYGNILPIDWSKSVAKELHMPALNMNPAVCNNNDNASRDSTRQHQSSNFRRKDSMNGNQDDGLSSEDEAVAIDLDMHALILSGLPTANQDPIKGADEVLKEIDDLMDAGASDESGVDSESRGSDAGDASSSLVVGGNRFRAEKLELLSQRELNDIYAEMEMKIRDLSESLIAKLALRDELEYEKELKNQFISLLLSIQNKKRHLGSSASHHRRTQKNGDPHAESKSNGNMPTMRFRGTNEPKYLTTIIPYHTGSGPPDSNSLQILIKILRAIDEDSPALPTLLTDYILKVLCP